MAIVPSGITILEAAVGDLISPVLFVQHSIGGFIADVTVEEDHVDELSITEFPVEQGAAITDNSYKMPAQLRITCGYSNSSIASGGDPNYVNAVYAQFLQLQANRQPFDVFTSKRVYQNMLIRRLHTQTNKDWANAMLLDVEMREIIIATTQTVTVPPASDMKNPQDTAATTSSGSRSLQPGSGFSDADALSAGIAPL